MLVELRVEAFAIIDALEVRFGEGLNVLTGETGAGKSILVDAIELLLGGRADPAVIRAGCAEAVVEGLFRGPGLGERARALGLPAEDDELLVRRTVPREGRGRVAVNGGLCTVAMLGQLARGLVDLSGQHEHLSLLAPARHLPLLDAAAGLGAEVASYQAAFATLLALDRERRALLAREAERARQEEFLAFQLEELDALAASPGEDDALAEERRVLAGAERLRAAADAVEAQVYSGEAAVLDALASAIRRLDDAAAIDGRLAPIRQHLEAARAEAEEAGRGLSRYLATLAADPERLSAVEDRLEALRAVSRKHGGTLAEALARRDAMREELAALSRSAERRGELDRALEAAGADARGKAAALTKKRAAAAQRLGKAVSAELGRLGMAGARLEVVLGAPSGELLEVAGGGPLGSQGGESAEFRLAANVGEAPRPLGKVASGGELSRALLALKRVLAAADPVATYVFDEVDAGIGGSTALVVGRMLRDVARERQVLCVTHLPQVAACADVHLGVEKVVVRGRTVARVVELGDDERVAALARMLSGDPSAKAARAAAAELVAAARGAGKGRRRAA